MYTLSRQLPDGSHRPISAGMLASDTDTLACEVLPGEVVIIGEETAVVCALSLDTEGHLQFSAAEDRAVQLAMSLREMRIALVENAAQFAQVTINLFEDNDTRLFVQVFPIPVRAEALSTV